MALHTYSVAAQTPSLMSVVEVPAAKTTSVHQQIGIRLWLGVVAKSFTAKTPSKSLCEHVIKP